MHRLKDIHLQLTTSAHAECASAVAKRTKTLCEGTILARDVCNERSEEMNPDSLSMVIKELGEMHRMRFTEIAGEDLLSHGMNLIYAVGKASRSRCFFLFDECESQVVQVGTENGGIRIQGQS